LEEVSVFTQIIDIVPLTQRRLTNFALKAFTFVKNGAGFSGEFSRAPSSLESLELQFSLFLYK